MHQDEAMYHDFYQFKENPFNVTADPDFYFSSNSHRYAITSLIYGIENRKGILAITGEIGVGKTTLCRALLRQSNPNTQYALILNPNFSELELLQLIIQDLGIRTKEKDKFGLINALNQFLIKQSNLGHNIAVIIDEAQHLSPNQLEQLRLLSNLETEKEKLLQIILVGQPELIEKLKLPELRQLRQRIAVHFHISPLERGDVRDYIHHRIKKAMKDSDTLLNILFSDQAINAIYHYTKGSPRAINILCDRALLAGFVSGSYSIDELVIERCAKEILYSEHYL
jgi:general secretion pathway protein A